MGRERNILLHRAYKATHQHRQGIGKAYEQIAPFLPLLVPGSRLLAGPEFDVEDNYRLAKWHDIDLQVKQKGNEARKSFRKKAKRKFSHEKYRKRKLGERPFGNVEVRGYRFYYRKEGHRFKGALLIGCEHNILAYFRNKAWSGLFKVFKPPDKAPPPLCAVQ